MQKQVFSAEIDFLYPMLNFIQECCSKKNLDQEKLNYIILAMEEALVNIIHHAYPQSKGLIEIEYEDIQNGSPGMQFTVKDSGIPFDPTLFTFSEVEKDTSSSFSTATNHDISLGGQGINLFLQIMDKVKYERDSNNYNYLIMIKYIK